jgi:hypothetical protein
MEASDFKLVKLFKHLDLGSQWYDYTSSSYTDGQAASLKVTFPLHSELSTVHRLITLMTTIVEGTQQSKFGFVLQLAPRPDPSRLVKTVPPVDPAELVTACQRFVRALRKHTRIKFVVELPLYYLSISDNTASLVTTLVEGIFRHNQPHDSVQLPDNVWDAISRPLSQTQVPSWVRPHVIILCKGRDLIRDSFSTDHPIVSKVDPVADDGCGTSTNQSRPFIFRLLSLDFRFGVRIPAGIAQHLNNGSQVELTDDGTETSPPPPHPCVGSVYIRQLSLTHATVLYRPCHASSIKLALPDNDEPCNLGAILAGPFPTRSLHMNYTSQTPPTRLKTELAALPPCSDLRQLHIELHIQSNIDVRQIIFSCDRLAQRCFPNLVELRISDDREGTFGLQVCNATKFQVSHFGALSIGAREIAMLTLALNICDVAAPTDVLEAVHQRVLYLARADLMR